jgi:hypothetical protein
MVRALNIRGNDKFKTKFLRKESLEDLGVDESIILK